VPHTPAQKKALTQLKAGVRKVLSFAPPPNLEQEQRQIHCKAGQSSPVKTSKNTAKFLPRAGSSR